jgi:hypothetical protein
MSKLRSALLVLLITLLSGYFFFSPLPAAAQRGKSDTQKERSLVGHVFNKDNQPVSRAVVYLKNTKTRVAQTYITEQDGTYRFPWLASNVDYELHAEFHGASSDTKTISSFDTRKQFDIILRLR